MDTATLVHLLLTYRYFILFPLVALEGPITTMAAGFLVSLNLLNPIIALPIIVAGDVTSDVFYYYVGWFGRRSALGRWLLRKFRLDEHEERVKRSFARRGGQYLLFGKLTHAFGAFFLIGAGYARMRLGKFIWYNTLGTIIKSSILLYVGFLSGAAYVRYAHDFETGALVVTVVSLGIVAVGLFINRIFRKQTIFPEDD